MQLAGQVSSVGTTRPTLAAARRREAQHVLRPVMAEIFPLEPAQHDTGGTKQSGRTHFTRRPPACCAISSHILRLACPPPRPAHGDPHLDESPRSRPNTPLHNN